jgi:hypothetical protein
MSGWRVLVVVATAIGLAFGFAGPSLADVEAAMERERKLLETQQAAKDARAADQRRTRDAQRAAARGELHLVAGDLDQAARALAEAMERDAGAPEVEKLARKIAAARQQAESRAVEPAPASSESGDQQATGAHAIASQAEERPDVAASPSPSLARRLANSLADWAGVVTGLAALAGGIAALGASLAWLPRRLRARRARKESEAVR